MWHDTLHTRKNSGLILIFFLIFIGSCEKSEKESGYLKGVISIGPICPVERVPPDPACLPTAETYKAYPVSVYTSDGEDRMCDLSPSLDGSYISELPPGKYLVILEKAGSHLGWSSLPVMVSIVSKDTTLLSITIDTGIR